MRACSPVRRGAVLFAGIVGVLIATSSPAAGQASYRLSPIGGRTTLLGGTAMTYGRDAAAGFVNPATAVLVDDQRLSFSVNFYRMSLLTSSQWFQPGPVDRQRFGDVEPKDISINDFSFEPLPSSLCLFFKVGDMLTFLGKSAESKRTREARLGLCAATTSRSSLDLAAREYSNVGPSGVTRQSQTISQYQNRFALGPTYALRVDDRFSLGVAVHGVLSTHRNLMFNSAVTYGSGPTPVNTMFASASRGDAFGFDAILGATYKFGNRQTFGVAVQTPLAHVFGVASANGNTSFDGPGAASSGFSARGSLVVHTPLRLSIGTGFEASWGNVAFDVSYYTPTTAYRTELEGNGIALSNGNIDDRPKNLDSSQRTRGAVNMAVGAEIGLSSALSLLSGLSTDVASVRKGDLRAAEYNYIPERTHRVAASLGINSHGEGGEIMFGTELSYGWGERLAVNSYQTPPTLGTSPTDVFTMMFVIAGSTSLHNIKRAVDDVREVVNPKAKKPETPPEKRDGEEQQKGRRDTGPNVLPTIPGDPPPVR